MQVPDPDQPVALHAVPQVLLHTEVDGVGAGRPDAVEAFVARTERSYIRYVAVLEYGFDLFEMQFAVIVQQVDAREAETRIAALHGPEPRQREREIAHGMVVRSAVRAVDVAHRLADRFAEADADPHGPVVRRHAGHDAQPALQLAAEVEQQPRTAAVAAAEHADAGILQVGLPVAGFEQQVAARDQVGLLLRDDAHGRHISIGARIEADGRSVPCRRQLGPGGGNGEGKADGKDRNGQFQQPGHRVSHRFLAFLVPLGRNFAGHVAERIDIPPF